MIMREHGAHGAVGIRAGIAARRFAGGRQHGVGKPALHGGLEKLAVAGVLQLPGKDFAVAGLRQLGA